MARYTALTVAAALVLAAAQSQAAHPLAAQVAGRAEQVARLDSIANAPVVQGRAAGLVVAVVKGGDTLLLRGYGQGDLEWASPMPHDAVFEIGSTTKQFTAAAVLQLRDDGRLDLDSEITKYLPDYPLQGKHVTVRQLLNHTSGIKGYTEMPLMGEIITRRLPRDSLVKKVAAAPFDFEPGTALIYNNSGYFLLGLIIEQVSGLPYEQYVEQKLFAPLGMHRSSYCSNEKVVGRRAHGYQLTRGNVLQRAPYLDHTWPYAAGSLCSTAGDLVTWLRALHGGQVLPERSYQELISPGTLNDGTPLRYAMGLSRTPDRARRPMIAHGGAIFGYVSETRWYPEADLYVVVLVNTSGSLDPAALAQELVEVLLPRPESPVRQAFTGDAAALAGSYEGPARGQRAKVVVAATPDGLTLSQNGGTPAPLAWVEGLTFELGGRLVEFRRNGGTGQASVLHIDGGGSGHYVLRRLPESP